MNPLGNILGRTIAVIGVALWMAVCVAEEAPPAPPVEGPVEGLDQQVQAIKQDVLRISAELAKIQEKLMYPSDTQVALFVSLTPGDKFRLDGVKIKIDGKIVTHYVYSPKELEALQKGGIQRIYTGNILGGTHSIDIEQIGKSADNRDQRKTSSHKFYKMKGPKAIQITLSELGSSIQSIAD